MADLRRNLKFMKSNEVPLPKFNSVHLKISEIRYKLSSVNNNTNMVEYFFALRLHKPVEVKPLFLHANLIFIFF